MDLMVRQYGYRHQSGYYYECQIETETVALAGASLAVRLEPDSYWDGERRLGMRSLEDCLLVEKWLGFSAKRLGLRVVGSCKAG